MKVGTLCTRETVMITPHDTLSKAASLMKNYDIGSLIVVDEARDKNKPLAIVTDRDIVLKAVACEKNSDIPLSSILSDKLVTAHEDELLFDTLEKMKYVGIRRMVVVDDDGFLVGLLSMDDIIDFLSDEMETISGLFSRSRKLEDKKSQGR